jgi:hypothetical protein
MQGRFVLEQLRYMLDFDAGFPHVAVIPQHCICPFGDASKPDVCVTQACDFHGYVQVAPESVRHVSFVVADRVEIPFPRRS